ncbi:MAG: type IX secretion system membrane protein PorP/SprF [Chlorobi bacterium]|nr:type IX secretion system membrane protein PorP/SprF [Chlorobiota bacterium]
MKRNMKRLILILTGIFGGLIATAQQAPHYTQFMYNMNMVNPAYAGIKNGLAAGVLYRTQWTGTEVHPTTGTINVHSRVGEKSGIGISGLFDTNGPVRQTDVKVDYSYTIPVASNLNLALGLNVGLGQDQVDFTMLQAIDPNDPLLTESPKVGTVTYGVGALLYSEKFYISLSAPNLNKSPYDKTGSTYAQGRTIHYFGAAGYVLPLNNSFKLKPHIMVYKANGTPISTMLNANLFMYDKLELGVSYRVKDAVSGLINFKITDNVRIGYAYDRTISSMKLYSPNTHEVFLNFLLRFKRPGIMSPIYF